MYIQDEIDKRFIYDSLACRKNKGGTFGIYRLKGFLNKSTYNGNRNAYYLKLDIKNFFYSINKKILLNLLTEEIQKLSLNIVDIDDLLWVSEEIINHNPCSNFKFTGDPSLLKEFVGKLTLDKNILGIHIFNDNGKIYCSSSNVDKKDIKSYASLIKPENFSEKLIEHTLPSSKSFYSYYRPLINEKECKKCHVKSGNIIGLLNINVESSQFFTSFTRKTFYLTWVLIIFSVLLSLVIIYMIKRLVTAPIKKLEYAMAAVSNGNFDVTMHINSGDEIESLSEYYNLMVNSLKNASETLNKMHRNMMHTDRLMTVGQITAAISHEIKNPLNSILIQADLLKSNIQNVDIRDTLIKIEGIISDCEKISKIINQTLNFSKNIPETWEIIDVGRFLRDLRLFSRRIFFDANNISFKIIDKRSNLYTKVYFNRVYLEQIFINLLKNAADAVSEKGKGSIILEIDNADNFIIFNIIDNGVGIEEDKIKYIFNEFYTTKQDGTGIGLAIVKYILDMYNGYIDVKSKVGEGTTFTVKIPIYKENISV
jgi:signal transduction histidine kinase